MNLENLLRFIEKTEGRKIPLYYKLKKNQELITQDDLIVNGDLDLTGESFKMLPDNLVINGNFYISDTEIRTIPKNLTVNGILYIHGTYISTIPSDLKIEHLDIESSNVESLPYNFNIPGYFNVRFCKLKYLPDNLKIGDDFYLSHNKITEIPNGLSIGGDFYLHGNPIARFSPNTIYRMIEERNGNVDGEIYTSI